MSAAISRFDRLVTLYGDRVYRKAYGMVKDPHLAQDVAQETFLKAYRHLDTVLDERRAGAWLSKIATNAAIDLMRKRRCWNGIPMEPEPLEGVCGADAEGVEEVVCRRLGAEQLMEQIAWLKPAYREVVWMKIRYGSKDAEIAERLGVSIGTVKSRFHRAKRFIRSRMDGSPSTAGTSPANREDARLPPP
ncbi:sigma-70 family RNA polymerase sigma factor [Paenibacillus antri]|uniref:RNA polymerase sigma factor n=1 Tax=Paenibacillus antri TaxID=2582848 RepID=A0A5R9GL11_9BACL|nr:sigma-70 family RNA polymerase sigma factor [Paenibacillus antri]TLS54334.1 sigma-70 family RNA polymerase sigma factor [Paenibacillus antri]